MTQVYFGLGSNLGDRTANLEKSIRLLQENGFQLSRVSPVVESPALLPEGAPSAWNIPFLNLVIEGDVDEAPAHWLKINKDIQNIMGRTNASRWSPRPVDIDILLWSDEVIETEDLTIPHKDLHKRAFVVSPLAHLCPDLQIPGRDTTTILEHARGLHHHIPLWMGIVNITPDSFSDGNVNFDHADAERTISEMMDAGVHIIDVGAESTRPGATPMKPDEEWQRLRPTLELIKEKTSDGLIGPLISIDTRHADVARQALELGVDIINDVSGLTNSEMLELACENNHDWVAMHHVTIPVDSNRKIAQECDTVVEVCSWFDQRLEEWDKSGIDHNRIILDPGIGFGKDSLHSLELMRHIEALQKFNMRLLVGHSRKSFMKAFSEIPAAERDIETVGASLKLCDKGVDIIRVHNVPAHVRAYTAWAHLEPYQ